MAAESLVGARVLVTGAGCVGSRLISTLAAGDVKEIRVLDSSAERLSALGNGIEPVVGDITNPGVVGEAFDSADVVFHTAAVLEGNDVAAYHRVNHTGTEILARAALAAGVRRFVHLSSVTVYGFAEGDVVESREPTPTAQAYSQSKAAGELAVRRLGKELGLPIAVIRPAGVFGPGARYFTGTYMKRAMRKPIRMVGNGRGSLPVTFVDDLVGLMTTVATHPAAVGEVFHSAIDPAPTLKEYMHAYGRLVGNESWLGIPTALVAAVGSVMVPISRKGTYARQLPRNVRQIDRTVRYRMDKARTLLGWSPRFDVESGVAASVPWLREQGILPEGA